MTVIYDLYTEVPLVDEEQGVFISLSELRSSGYTEEQIATIEHPRDPDTGRFIPRSYEIGE